MFLQETEHSSTFSLNSGNYGDGKTEIICNCVKGTQISNQDLRLTGEIRLS